MNTTITLALDPSATVVFERQRISQSDQRYSAIRVFLSLVELFETLGDVERAGYWKRRAELAGWREWYSL